MSERCHEQRGQGNVCGGAAYEAEIDDAPLHLISPYKDSCSRACRRRCRTASYRVGSQIKNYPNGTPNL